MKLQSNDILHNFARMDAILHTQQLSTESGEDECRTYPKVYFHYFIAPDGQEYTLSPIDFHALAEIASGVPYSLLDLMDPSEYPPDSIGHFIGRRIGERLIPLGLVENRLVEKAINLDISSESEYICALTEKAMLGTWVSTLERR